MSFLDSRNGFAAQRRIDQSDETQLRAVLSQGCCFCNFPFSREGLTSISFLGAFLAVSFTNYGLELAAVIHADVNFEDRLL